MADNENLICQRMRISRCAVHACNRRLDDYCSKPLHFHV